MESPFDYRRTHTCGEITSHLIGSEVTLCGWVHRRRDHGGLIFVDLRDRYGLTQLVFDPTVDQKMHESANQLRSEWVVSVKGSVIPRAEGMQNPNLQTGEIEIQVKQLGILEKSLTPPFSVCDEYTNANEDLRLQYRYLDIRRGLIAKNLQIRHQVMSIFRNFLSTHDFLEIQTPILGKSTPEGARDYLVPSRVHSGQFYALPQSPQLFKQLLMIAGMDRYFQVAPCFRDEDLRSDRQPEFTQIDIEMSFSHPKDLQTLVEKGMKQLFKQILDLNIAAPFQRLSYETAMESYGTDKPDLRFGMPLVRVDSIVKNGSFSVFLEQLEMGGIVKGICIKNGASLSRKEIDQLAAFVSDFGLKGLGWMKHQKEGLTSSIVKFFDPPLQQLLIQAFQSTPGDLLVFAAEQEAVVNQALDHLRRHVAKKQNLIDPNQYAFAWVTDFPLVEWDAEEGRFTALHHPFTAPHPDDLNFFTSNPAKVRSLAYDLVLNGYEIGGGSQRIHNEATQKMVFDLLKLSSHEIETKFGFFMQSLRYGTPPHLGIALGLDRIVMLLAKTENIRDVIAFPKTQKASDLMMKCPSSVHQNQLHELNLKVAPLHQI